MIQDQTAHQGFADPETILEPVLADPADVPKIVGQDIGDGGTFPEMRDAVAALPIEIIPPPSARGTERARPVYREYIEATFGGPETRYCGVGLTTAAVLRHCVDSLGHLERSQAAADFTDFALWRGPKLVGAVRILPDWSLQVVNFDRPEPASAHVEGPAPFDQTEIVMADRWTGDRLCKVEIALIPADSTPTEWTRDPRRGGQGWRTFEEGGRHFAIRFTL
jgi:hypothetical protein